MRKKFICKIFLFIVVMLLLTNVILFNDSAVKNENYGLSLFFSIINSNRNIMFLIVFSLLYPAILLVDYFDYDNNKFSNLIAIRLGMKKYYLQAISKVFATYSIIIMTLYLMMLLNIHFIWSAVSFDIDQHIGMYFSVYPLTNLVLFLLTSSLGAGMYACFLFTIIFFCNNKYVYRITMILNILLSIVITPFIVGFVRGSFAYNTFTNSISYLLVPSGLLAPGTMPDMELSGMINFISCGIVYSLMTIVMLVVSYRRRAWNG